MTRRALATIALLVWAGVGLRAQDARSTLTTARDLYASAAYEDALRMLDRLHSAGVQPEESAVVDQYRAFCLLALGRTAEAKGAIEAAVTANPLYRPSEDEVSPRVRTVFSDVRRQMLPTLVQQRYAEAKLAFDQKDYKAAVDRFSQVLKVLADTDLATAANNPALADLRVLATGFQELAAKAILPPLPAQEAPLRVPPPPAEPTSLSAASTPSAPSPKRAFTSTDAGVVPPRIVQQDVPTPSRRTAVPLKGVVEVLINETGSVESATIRESINASYDPILLNAARHWRYEPATLNGAPVRFLKLLGVSIAPAP